MDVPLQYLFLPRYLTAEKSPTWQNRGLPTFGLFLNTFYRMHNCRKANVVIVSVPIHCPGKRKVYIAFVGVVNASLNFNEVFP
jgi:hypothetical protein